MFQKEEPVTLSQESPHDVESLIASLTQSVYEYDTCSAKKTSQTAQEGFFLNHRYVLVYLLPYLYMIRYINIIFVNTIILEDLAEKCVCFLLFLSRYDILIPIPITMHIDTLFEEAHRRWASDIHIKEWEQMMLRIEGGLVPSESAIHPNRILMFDFLYDLLYNRQRERISEFKHSLELDFWTVRWGISYRGNVYMYMGKISIALRKIGNKVKTLMELGVPRSIARVLQAKQWLFLVTGPTGSGKSTTMASMLETINATRSEHVITIEDPIEYIFENKKSIFSQREVGRDTISFKNAIRSVMREDADIVVIGEIRDAETMESAINLAETGHLVFATLHTASSVQTITRMIQFFPPELESQARTRISECLVGVISQRLIPKKDNTGRVAIRELMYVNPGIKNVIATGNFSQINGAIEIGSDYGMFTMKQHAESLANQGIIEEKDYIGYFMSDQLQRRPRAEEMENDNEE